MHGYVLAAEGALGEPAYLPLDTLSVSCKEQSGWDADHELCLAPQFFMCGERFVPLTSRPREMCFLQLTVRVS